MNSISGEGQEIGWVWWGGGEGVCKGQRVSMVSGATGGTFKAANGLEKGSGARRG
jgi:hypothetical protein